jgi:hypothetical protein
MALHLMGAAPRRREEVSDQRQRVVSCVRFGGSRLSVQVSGVGVQCGRPVSVRSRVRCVRPELLRGRPRSVTAQAPELRECKIGITLFDCPRDRSLRRRWGRQPHGWDGRSRRGRPPCPRPDRCLPESELGDRGSRRPCWASGGVGLELAVVGGGWAMARSTAWPIRIGRMRPRIARW